MTQSTKLAARAPFPAVSVPRFGGGEIAPVLMEGWRLLVVYRGKHCPLPRTAVPSSRNAGVIRSC